MAAKRGLVYVSTYNDPEIIGGQGTIALELLEQMPEVDNVFVAMGDGALVVEAMKVVHPGLGWEIGVGISNSNRRSRMNTHKNARLTPSGRVLLAAGQLARLTKPEAKDQVAMPSPLTSGADSRRDADR